MSLRLTTGRSTAGLRRLAARRPWTRWIPISTCGVALVLTALTYTSDIDATKRAWGERRPVWVAAADIAAGSPIEASSIDLPVVAVPESAASTDEPVAGLVARQRIGKGEIVTVADLGGGDPLSILPDGWRAVAVSESPASGAQAGDQVDVVSEGVVLAQSGVVIAAFDGFVLVGVTAGVAPLVALANETGVALLRSGVTGPP